ncbi:hypothetical protein CGRA01v4_02361 [Colletotrichum graminicola]|nr:hypothetical protein CGRA01v4_02361 [Colletotrichum graminicola]
MGPEWFFACSHRTVHSTPTKAIYRPRRYSRLLARTNRGAVIITKMETAPAKLGKDQKHHGPSTLSGQSSQYGRIARAYNGAPSSSSQAAWRHPSFRRAACTHTHTHTHPPLRAVDHQWTSGETGRQAGEGLGKRQAETSKRYARRIRRGTCRSER